VNRVYRKAGLTRLFSPERGLVAGLRIHGEPLHLAAGRLSRHGSGAHAPDEYYVIESKTPKVTHGWRRHSYVELLYGLAQAS